MIKYFIQTDDKLWLAGYNLSPGHKYNVNTSMFLILGRSRWNSICCPPKSQRLAQRSNRARPRRADANDCDRSLRGEFTCPPLARVLWCVGLFLGWPFHTPVFIYRGRGAMGCRDLSESLNTIRHAHALACSERNTSTDPLLTLHFHTYSLINTTALLFQSYCLVLKILGQLRCS